MIKFNLLTFTVLFLFSTQGLGQNLKVNIEGVSGPILANVKAHLGSMPTNEEERTNFLFNAKLNIQRAMHAYSYFNAQIITKVDRSSDPWLLNVKIKSNQQTVLSNVDVKLSGAAEQEQSFNAIVNQYKMQPDEVLDQLRYEDLKSALFNEGLELGYFDATFAEQTIAVNRAINKAEISLIYASGDRYRFGAITFDPIELNPWIVDSLTPMQAGDFYQADLLLQLQNQLQQSGYFSSITVRPKNAESTNNDMPIHVGFKPAKRHYFDVGVGYATDTKERFTIGWKMPHINRRGHKLEAKLAYSKINPTGKFSYSIPLTHPYNDVLKLGFRLEDDEFGDLSSKQTEYRIARVRNEGGWVRTAYLRYLEESWQDLLSDTNMSTHFVLPGFSWSRTTKSGSAVDPENGFSQMYVVEGTAPALGSDISLLHFYSRFKWVHRFNQHHRFVAKSQFAISEVKDDEEEKLAPSLRFFAGGDQSIRGFAYQSLGPEIKVPQEDGTLQRRVIGGSRIATASAEYQYYFNENWRSPIFFDIGQAFDGEKIDPVYAIGSGIHYMSPIGAIRLEAAYGISEDNPPWRIHFTMGAEL